MNLLSGISTILIFIALFSSYRLFVGPSIYDRIISLNVVGVIITVILTIMSIETGTGLYLDIAISFVLLDFVGTMAFIKYLEGGDFK
ncbi:MAG: monovalent cation/H+ antiporter complex subunit F [Candidatus Saliniplasma sp.]